MKAIRSMTKEERKAMDSEIRKLKAQLERKDKTYLDQ